MPYRATWGALSFGQEAKAGVKRRDQHLYWGWCGKGKVGQGKHFRISQRESFWQAFGFRGWSLMAWYFPRDNLGQGKYWCGV